MHLQAIAIQFQVKTAEGVVTSTFVGWAWHVISGVATATLAAEIVQKDPMRNLKN